MTRPYLVVYAALFAVCGLMWAAHAEAATILCESTCTRPYQRWVDEAKVPTPERVLSVIEDSSECEGASACTEEGAKTIWFGSGTRQTFYHELGHNFDYQMPEWVRTRYLAILGRAGPWRQPEALHYSPNELFAESYALCAFRLAIPRGGSVHGEEPVGGWRAHNRACRLITRAA